MSACLRKWCRNRDHKSACRPREWGLRPHNHSLRSPECSPDLQALQSPSRGHKGAGRCLLTSAPPASNLIWCPQPDSNRYAPFGCGRFSGLFGFRRPALGREWHKAGSGSGARLGLGCRVSVRPPPSALYTFRAGDRRSTRLGSALPRRPAGPGQGVHRV